MGGTLCLLLLLLPSFVLATSATSPTSTHNCDVVVAGGSLASAAAAVAAGEASNSTRVCFLEITDWPGGQASAGGIPAMDFGLQYLNFPHNIPQSLADLLTYGPMGAADYNPGECQYLPKCFAPKWVAEWILGRLAALPNVSVFLNTAIVGVDRDGTGRVAALRAVQRTPTPQHLSGWDRPLSSALPDWYSRTPSAYFDKAELQFVVAPTGVVVEATEFGDVLMLADGVAVGQGMELVSENSTKYDEHCGNPAAFSVFAEWGTAPLPPLPPPPPPPNTNFAGGGNATTQLLCQSSCSCGATGPRPTTRRGHMIRTTTTTTLQSHRSLRATTTRSPVAATTLPTRTCCSRLTLLGQRRVRANGLAA